MYNIYVFSINFYCFCLLLGPITPPARVVQGIVVRPEGHVVGQGALLLGAVDGDAEMELRPLADVRLPDGQQLAGVWGEELPEQRQVAGMHHQEVIPAQGAGGARVDHALANATYPRQAPSKPSFMVPSVGHPHWFAAICQLVCFTIHVE